MMNRNDVWLHAKWHKNLFVRVFLLGITHTAMFVDIPNIMDSIPKTEINIFATLFML